MSEDDTVNPETVPYPEHLSADVVLRTGATLYLRPIRRDDEQPVLEFYRRLSRESLHQRFFDLRTPEAALISSPAAIDYRDDFGLVAETGSRIVGIAHYFRHRGARHRAEVAFTISDDMQGCGIGTHLLERLASIALENAITEFDASVLTENRKMIDVFSDAGFDVQWRLDGDTVQIRFLIQPTNRSAERSADRAQKAASASMKTILEPRSIAVIGAGRTRGQLGAEILRNLVDVGFRGPIYPINPNAVELEGLRSYPRITDVNEPVDLAIIVVPAGRVEGVIDDCITKGVRGLVVITAGFGETGPEGRVHEARLVDKIRSAGIRMVGPNCMGVINADPDIRMQATFAPIYPPSGNIAMSTQSGALGLAILDYAKRLGLGFSTFVSVGNKADISGNDLIQYWAEDPRTDVILLYLESFGNPNKFSRIARRVARQKPIVAVKSGRSRSGARAASSHTGALATSDDVVRDLFKQAGVIRTDTLEELFDVAAVLANQPLPRGRRLGIVTNAGGPGILAADAAEACGLVLPQPSPGTVTELRSFLPAAASVGNPVDMIASASTDHYRRAIKLMLDDDQFDALMVIYIPILPEGAEQVSVVIREAMAGANGKPIVATVMSAMEVSAALMPVPSFPFPERAVVAMGRASAYAEWKARPEGKTVSFEDIDESAIRSIIDASLSGGGGWLAPDLAFGLLKAVGIEVADAQIVTTEDAAAGAAARIGGPVAMKAVGAAILHKSDVGGVKLDLEDEASVRQAFNEFASQFGDGLSGVAVQRMVEHGVEVMIGAVLDPTFGHLVVYGGGGVLVELLKDASFRIHPLTDLDVHDMLEEVRSTTLLRGYRGSPPADEVTLRDAIARLSVLIEIAPEILELDMNPLVVLEKGAVAVDVRVRVGRVEQSRSRRISY